MKIALALLTALFATGATGVGAMHHYQRPESRPAYQPSRKKRFVRPPTLLREKILRKRAETFRELS